MNNLYQQLQKGNSSQTNMMSQFNNNPNMATVMGWVKQYGNDPKKAFYAKAKEMGVDPSSILSMINK